MRKVKRYRNIFDGIVHYDGPPYGMDDYALCGLTTADDPSLPVKMEETDEVVTCPECLATLAYCRRIEREMRKENKK